MKKQYNKPTMVVINMKETPQLLAGSGSGNMNAPVYPGYWDEDEE